MLSSDFSRLPQMESLLAGLTRFRQSLLFSSSIEKKTKGDLFLKNKVSFLSSLPFIFQCICERESPCIKDEICVPDYEDDAKHFCKCIGSGKASIKILISYLFIFFSLIERASENSIYPG